MERKIKVLIADDDTAITQLLGEVLRSFGFEVAVANDGKAAIEQVEKEKPNVVLLDLNMPGLDGFQTCESLRKNSENYNLPIIILTGREEESAIVTSLECGADDYLTKPFDQDELFKKIEKVLAKAKADTLPSQLYFKKLQEQKSR